MTELIRHIDDVIKDRENVDRYLKVTGRARSLYSRDGWIVKSNGGIPSPYTNCERLTFAKYIEQ